MVFQSNHASLEKDNKWVQLTTYLVCSERHNKLASAQKRDKMIYDMKPRLNTHVFYVAPASLHHQDRCRESNVFPLALGPHGSDFSQVVKALHSMRHLDQGIRARINGEDVRLCAFTMCYTGDMPQQAENSGFKGPRAHKFCRFCYIGAKPEAATDNPTAIMDIDTVKHGRYHVQTTHDARRPQDCC